MPNASIIDRKAGEDIARKLGVPIEAGRKHDQVIIRWEGKIVGRYGLRRDRHAGHGYIPSQIHLSLRQTLELAECSLSVDGYFEVLRGKGLL